MERHPEIGQGPFGKLTAQPAGTPPRGLLRSKEIAVTSTFQAILMGPWLSYDVFNDGPGDIYVLHEDIRAPWGEGYAPLHSGESISYDLAQLVRDMAGQGAMSGPKAPLVYVVCKSGVTATARAFWRI